MGRLLEIGSRSVALATGVAYFLGLIVTNVHLARYGANFLGFLSIQYLAAGIWAAYPSAVGASIAFLLSEPLRSSTSAKPLVRLLDNLARTISLGLLASALGVSLLPL